MEAADADADKQLGEAGTDGADAEDRDSQRLQGRIGNAAYGEAIAAPYTRRKPLEMLGVGKRPGAVDLGQCSCVQACRQSRAGPKGRQVQRLPGDRLEGTRKTARDRKANQHHGARSSSEAGADLRERRLEVDAGALSPAAQLPPGLRRLPWGKTGWSRQPQPRTVVVCAGCLGQERAPRRMEGAGAAELVRAKLADDRDAARASRRAQGSAGGDAPRSAGSLEPFVGVHEARDDDDPELIGRTGVKVWQLVGVPRCDQAAGGGSIQPVMRTLEGPSKAAIGSARRARPIAALALGPRNGQANVARAPKPALLRLAVV